MTDAPERICYVNCGLVGDACACYRSMLARAATPMRCAECDCEKGGADCNWIATPTPAMCCLGLTPEQCASTPSSQCEGLRPAVNPLDDPRVKALVKKARAVVDRWDSPLWKDLRHTGTLINELRATISALEENK